MQDTSGTARLTPRENETLELMASGRTNRAIGIELQLSERTVESHVRAIYRKLVDDPTGSLDRRVIAVRRFLEGDVLV